MHNHLRMYVASICCNIGNSHWLNPSKWMYANLLDGDLASNQLSWQWVAGAFSNKKYYANQDNINNFFNSEQKKTFLDVDYSEFENMQTPKKLLTTQEFKMSTQLPKKSNIEIIKNEKTLIYNYYNLDPEWHKKEKTQRILLLEPSVFKKHPVSQKCIDFILDLSENIPGIKLFVGEFNELTSIINSENIIFKEHPLNNHYEGKKEDREWLSNVEGFYPSFFSFWKKCKKNL